jgi:p-hydroxybenzoate 3-monooxygenase
VYLAFNGRRHHIDMAGLTNGRAITIYGQNEVVHDLIDAVLAQGTPLHFEAGATTVSDLDSDRPAIHFIRNGEPVSLRCDFIAGCDGFHGICRGAIPEGWLRTYERVYPFGWLGILAEAPPSSDELVYSRHERGFALFSMRSKSVTRLYLQCEPDENIANWSGDRIWSELQIRLATDDGWKPAVGKILRKDVTGMRSFVAEPMQYGRLFLAGDAAHIVPPTGAKGLNLALADVQRLAGGLGEYYKAGSARLLDEYSTRGLRRAWRAQRFSWWMTTMFHKPADESPFDERRQLADLEYIVGSRAAMTSLAESYVGTPFD